jgi:hypothetical protein
MNGSLTASCIFSDLDSENTQLRQMDINWRTSVNTTNCTWEHTNSVGQVTSNAIWRMISTFSLYVEVRLTSTSAFAALVSTWNIYSRSIQAAWSPKHCRRLNICSRQQIGEVNWFGLRNKWSKFDLVILKWNPYRKGSCCQTTAFAFSSQYPIWKVRILKTAVDSMWMEFTAVIRFNKTRDYLERLNIITSAANCRANETSKRGKFMASTIIDSQCSVMHLLYCTPCRIRKLRQYCICWIGYCLDWFLGMFSPPCHPDGKHKQSIVRRLFEDDFSTSLRSDLLAINFHLKIRHFSCHGDWLIYSLPTKQVVQQSYWGSQGHQDNDTFIEPVFVSTPILKLSLGMR